MRRDPRLVKRAAVLEMKHGVRPRFAHLSGNGGVDAIWLISKLKRRYTVQKVRQKKIHSDLHLKPSCRREPKKRPSPRTMQISLRRSRIWSPNWRLNNLMKQRKRINLIRRLLKMTMPTWM